MVVRVVVGDQHLTPRGIDRAGGVAFEVVAYDALNRVTLKTVGTGPAQVETRFTYDEVRAGFFNLGRETAQEVWTPTGTVHKVEREWHLMGGLAVERHTIDGRSYALETSFAPNGAPLDQRLPGMPGATTTGWIGPFTYDAAGRVTAMTGYITSVSYNAWGQPTAAAYANGVTEAYVYDLSRGWLTSVTGTLPGGDMAFRAAYDRSATGRIFRADTQALVAGTPTDLGGSYDYAYDDTGRLVSATNWRGVTAFDQVFAYDRAGRIRAKGATLATAMTYDYTDPLTPDHAPGAVTAGGVTTDFTYDANGNMLTGLAGKIMTYDGENRPLSVTHLGKRTCYVYGVDGKRLKKVEGLPPTQDCTALPANAATTVYFGAVEVRNWLVAGAEQVLTYPHPAVKLLNGTTPAAATYLHRDGLSSVRAITDAAGVKIESALYKPFGEQSEWLLPGNAAPETKGWIGERYDADAGLQYLNARYYDPELSLFLQPDWFEVTMPGVGTNRFSYSFNDPINRWDPNGNQSKDDLEREHDEISKMIDEAQDAIANGEDISPDDLAELYGIRDNLQSQIDESLIRENMTLTGAVIDIMQSTASKKVKVGREVAEQLLTGVRKNYVAGARRQADVVAEQKKLYPNASVQTEQYLRGADGKILKGPDGTGRRLDIVVIQDGKVIGHPIEVTSMTAPKGDQIFKETNIHQSNGSVFVRDRTTGNLVEITGLVSRVERRP